MKIWNIFTRINDIEKRILEITILVSRDSTERGLSNRGIVREIVEDQMKAEDEPLLKEKTLLETERRFLLDRRESVLWRMMWLVAGALFVIITEYLLKKFGLK